MPNENLDDLNHDQNLDFLEEEHLDDQNTPTPPGAKNKILQDFSLDRFNKHKRSLIIGGLSFLALIGFVIFRKNPSEQVLITRSANSPTNNQLARTSPTTHNHNTYISSDISSEAKVVNPQPEHHPGSEIRIEASPDKHATPANTSAQQLAHDQLSQTVTGSSTHSQAPNVQDLPAITNQILPENLLESVEQLKSHAATLERVEPAYVQQLKNTITNLNQELAANVAKIQGLQTDLTDVAKAITNMQASINNLDHKILNLNQTVDELSTDLKNVKKYIQEEDLELAANLKTAEPDLFSNNPEYVIHAVIPGRAWLKTATGQIITVTEGDPLGNYGKVAFIDAVNNLVRTSSGIVFR